MNELTKRQQQIYDFIKAHYEKHSIPPTVREICAAVSLRSTSTVHLHLKELVKKGYITMEPLKQRSIALVHGTNSAYNTEIHLVGDVAAGQPILAMDNIEETFSLPNSLLHGASSNEVFLLKIEGESMINIGMFSGDMIAVHNSIDASNGDIVVARVGGDSATVKRIFREKDHIRLQPENSAMKPICVPYSDVEIVGKVICLIRRY